MGIPGARTCCWLLAAGCFLACWSRAVKFLLGQPPPPPSQQSQELPGCQVKVKSPLSSPPPILYPPPPTQQLLEKSMPPRRGGGERSQDNMDAVTQDGLRRVPVQLCGGWGRRGGSQCTREELIVGIIDRQLGHPLPTTPPHTPTPSFPR